MTNFISFWVKSLPKARWRPAGIGAEQPSPQSYIFTEMSPRWHRDRERVWSLGLAGAGLERSSSFIPSSSFIHLLGLPGMAAGEQGHRVSPVPPSPALVPSSQPRGPFVTCSFMSLLHQTIHLTRVKMNKAQGIPLIPALPSWWSHPRPEGQELKQCCPCQSRYFSAEPGAQVCCCCSQGPVSGFAPSCLHHPSPLPTSTPRKPLHQRTDGNVRLGKGKEQPGRTKREMQSKEKSNSQQHSRASSLLPCLCLEIFPRNIMKKGMAENFHFVLTVTVETVKTVQTINVKITPTYTQFRHSASKLHL